jgi:hypothetical protein
MIVNAAAGLDDQPITLEAIREILTQETALFGAVVSQLLS